MRLPPSPESYTRDADQTMRSMLQQANDQNHKRLRDVEISPGRLIIKSPDGTRWSIEVDNSGNVSATSL
jgi:hypothetical protein